MSLTKGHNLSWFDITLYNMWLWDLGMFLKIGTIKIPCFQITMNQWISFTYYWGSSLSFTHTLRVGKNPGWWTLFRVFSAVERKTVRKIRQPGEYIQMKFIRHRDYFISHYKDPYETTSKIECQQGFERCSYQCFMFWYVYCQINGFFLVYCFPRVLTFHWESNLLN